MSKCDGEPLIPFAKISRLFNWVFITLPVITTRNVQFWTELRVKRAEPQVTDMDLAELFQPVFEEFVHSFVYLFWNDESFELTMLGAQLGVMGCICCKSCKCCCAPSKRNPKAIEGGGGSEDVYHIPGSEHIPRKVKRSPSKEVLRANRQTRKELAEWEERRRSLSLLEKGWLFRSSKSEAALYEMSRQENTGSCTTISSIREESVEIQCSSRELSLPPADMQLRRCESEQPKALKSCLVTGQRRWGSVQDASGLFAEVIPLQGTSSCAFQIKKVKKTDSRKGGFKNMKRGFKQFFAQDRSQREYESEHELTPQQGRRGSGGGFFQKLFRGNGKPEALSLTQSPVGSPMSARRQDWESEDDYAEILNARAKSNERDTNLYPGPFLSGKKRELSVPISPKSVTFEDEISRYGRAESAIPYQSNSRWRSGTQTSGYGSPGRPSYEMDMKKSSHSVLDEATLDLLRLSTEPAAVTFSSSPRRSHVADKLPKAASTSSMHKVIRTDNGGLLKVANVFTWDADRLKENSPDGASPRQTNDPMSERKVTENGDVIEVVQRVEGKPIVRTTVEGKMRMEKVVGAKLKTIDELISAGWTIRDTVTNYKIKTTLGNRQMVVEEERVGSAEDLDSQYRMHMYKDGREIGAHVANIDIPGGASKSEYLTKLSEQLMREMAAFEGEQETATTRVEVEVVENVTNLMKTYIIGQRDDAEEVDEALTAQVPQLAEKEFNVETASDRASPVGLEIERMNKEYVDQMERELELEMAKKDIKLTTPGKQFEGAARIVQHKRLESDTESVDSVIARRSIPRCANAFADCDLVRMMDSSSNQVFIAVPNEIALEVILRTERRRTKPKPVEPASYGMEQIGQHYEDTTILKRTTRFESAVSDDVFEEPLQPILVQPLVQPPEPPKEPSEPPAVEEEILMKQEQVLEQEQLLLKEEPRDSEPEGAEYSMQQEGQYFEGEAVIRKKVRTFISEEESEEEKEKKVSEPEGAMIDLAQAGQCFEDRAVLKCTRRFESEESEDKGPTEVVLVKDESNGIFTLTIEGSNSESAEFTTREKRPQKLETASIQMSIRKAVEESDVWEKSLGESQKQAISHQITATSEENAFLSQVIQNASRTDTSETTSTTLRDATVWSESFKGIELSEESATIMVALQNHISALQLQLSSEYNWASKQHEKTKSRVRETAEENAMTMYSFANNERRCLSVESLLKDQTVIKHSFLLDAAQSESATLSISLSCPDVRLSADYKSNLANQSQVASHVNEFLTEQTSALVYLANAVESVDERTHKTLSEPRMNTGNRLNAYSQTHKDLAISMDVSRKEKFASSLEASASRAIGRTEKLSLKSSSSSTEMQMANYALNRGAKTATATLKIVAANAGTPQHYDIVEAGNEVENCAVMMTCGGVSGMHASTSWAEQVSGESSPEIYDLNTVNITKRMHLSNYKSLLPLHGFTHTTWPSTSETSESFCTTAHTKTHLQRQSSLLSSSTTVINREEVDETENVTEKHITEINEKITHRARSKSTEYRAVTDREEIWEDESLSKSVIKEDLYRKRMTRSMTDVSTYTVDMEEVDVVDSTVKVRKQDASHTTTILVYEPLGGQSSSREMFGPYRYRQIYERVEEAFRTDDSKTVSEAPRQIDIDVVSHTDFDRKIIAKRTETVSQVLPEQRVFRRDLTTRYGDESSEVVYEMERTTEKETSSTTEAPRVSETEVLSTPASQFQEVDTTAALASLAEAEKLEFATRDSTREGVSHRSAPSKEESYSLSTDYSVVEAPEIPVTFAKRESESKSFSAKAPGEEHAEVVGNLQKSPSSIKEALLWEVPTSAAERGFEVSKKDLSYTMKRVAADELPVEKALPRVSEDRDSTTVREITTEQAILGIAHLKILKPQTSEETEKDFGQTRQLYQSMKTKAAGEESTVQETDYSRPSIDELAQETRKIAPIEQAILQTPSSREVTEQRDIFLTEAADIKATAINLTDKSIVSALSTLTEATESIANTSSQWDYCETGLRTQITVPQGLKEVGVLSPMASKEQSVDVAEALQKTTSEAAMRTQRDMSLDEARLALKVEEQAASHAFSRAPEPSEADHTLADTLSDQQRETIREYQTESVSFTASSERLSRPTPFESADIAVHETRRLEDQLRTAAASSEIAEKFHDFSVEDRADSSQTTRTIANEEKIRVSTASSKSEHLQIADELRKAGDTELQSATVTEIGPKSSERSMKEASDEQKQLFANMDTLVSEMKVSGTLMSAETEAKSLTASAAKLLSCEVESQISKAEGSVERSIILPSEQAEQAESRRFGIASENVALGLQQSPESRADSISVSEAEELAVVGKQFLEYGEEFIESAGQFQKLSKKTLAEEEGEMTRPVQRRLQQSFSTQFAREEMSSAELDESRSESVGFDSLVRRISIAESSEKSVSASTEEHRDVSEVLSRGEERKFTEKKEAERAHESSERSTKEPPEEQKQLFADIDTVVTEMKTTGMLKSAQAEAKSLTTSAAKLISSDLERHISKAEGSAERTYVLPAEQAEQAESTKFRIASEGITVGMEQTPEGRADSIRLSEARESSVVGKQFLEYGEESVELVGQFQRLAKKTLTEEEQEIVHSVPRRLQQTLCTEFAQEEASSADLEQSRSESVGHDSLLSRVSNVESSQKSLSASTEEHRLLSQAISREGESIFAEKQEKETTRESTVRSMREASQEQKQLFATMDTVITEMKATGTLKSADSDVKSLTTSAAKLMTSEMESHISKTEGSAERSLILPADQAEQAESLKFGIASQDISVGLELTSRASADSISISEAEGSSVVGTRFLEYGEECIESAGQFQKLAKAPLTEEEQEVIRSIPRQLQQSLSTEFAREEVSSAEVEQSRAVSVGQDSLVRRVSNIESVDKTLSASTEEHRLLSQAISREGESIFAEKQEKETNRESTERSLKETSEEQKQMFADIDTVITELKATGMLKSSEAEAKSLTTSAAKLITSELESHISKAEGSVERTYVLPSEQAEHAESVKFAIASEDISVGLHQTPEARADSVSINEARESSLVGQRYPEYGEKCIESVGQFQKLAKATLTEEEQEIVRSIPRQLQQSLSTEFAREETSSAEVQQIRSESVSQDSLVRRLANVVSSEKTLSASTDEQRDVSQLLSRGEERQSAENVVVDIRKESDTKRAKESSVQTAQLCQSFETVVNSMKTTETVTEASFDSQEVRIPASREQSLAVDEHVSRVESVLTTTRIIPDELRADEKRLFEIHDEKVEVALKQADTVTSESTCISESVQQTVLSRPILEYGQESSETMGNFERITSTRPTEEDSQYVYSMPRTLQQSLSTEHTKEEIAEVSIEKTKFEDAASDAMVKRIAHDQRLQQSLLSSTEESRETTDALIRKGTEGHAENVLLHRHRESSERKTIESGDENRSLYKTVDVVLRSMKASETIAESVCVAGALTTKATGEESESLESHILRSERELSAGFVIAQKEKAGDTSKFKDSVQVISEGFASRQHSEATSIALKDSREEALTGRPFMEFRQERLEAAGAFHRMTSEGATEEEAEATRHIPRHLQQSLCTSYAKDESATANIDQHRRETTDRTDTVNVVANVEAFAKSVAASVEEQTAFEKSLAREIDEVSTQNIFKGVERASSEKRCLESRDESFGYSTHMSIVSNRLHAGVTHPDKPYDSHRILAKAAGEEDTAIDQYIQDRDAEEHSQISQVYSQREATMRKFEIGESVTEKSLSRADGRFISEAKLRDARAASTPAFTTREYQQAVSDSIAHFGRIASERDDHLGVEEVVKISRHWQESLKSKAAGDKKHDETVDLLKTAASLSTQKQFKCPNDTDGTTLSAKSATESDVQSDKTFSVSAHAEGAEKLLVEKPLAAAGGKWKETSTELGSLSSEWTVVLNDLEAELRLADRETDRAELKTMAAGDTSQTVESTLSFQCESGLSAQQLALIGQEDARRQFKISEQILNQNLQRDSEATTISAVAKTDVRGQQTSSRFVETTKEDVNAGVLLVRRSVGRTSVLADHVVSVNALLAQSLNTVSASDVCETEKVEWTGREQAETSVKVLKCVNEEQTSTKVKASEESQTRSEWSLVSKVTSADECTTQRRVGNFESGSRRLVESSADAFDILTQWTTVFNDLEAHIRLASTLNMYNRLTTVESTEESIAIGETWDRKEDQFEGTIALREPVVESATKSLCIREEEMTESVENVKRLSEEVSATLQSSNEESSSLKTRESGLVKLNALVNLHKISTSLPKRANELILNDSLTISAEPHTLRTDAAETDFATVQCCLQKPTDARRDELKIVHYNSVRGVQLETEQAGDEKVKMLVDLQGLSYEKDQTAVEWKLPNQAEAIVLETEESEEDHATLYAQLTSKHELEKEADVAKSIARRHEPLNLKTKASTEETKTVSEAWSVPPKTERQEIVRKISNVEEPVQKKTFQSEDRIVSVGYYYSTPTAAETTSSTQIDKRSLGNYELKTKAASSEEKTLTFSLLRKQESELQKTRWQTKSKSAIDLRVLESSVEDATLTFNLSRPHSTEFIGTTRVCARFDTPFGKKCRESSLFEETIHCGYKRQNQEDQTAFTKDIPNFGGISVLSTDAAEESHIAFTPEIKRYDEFATAATTITDVNVAEPLTLRSICSTEESAVSTTNYIRSDSVEGQSAVFKCANRGLDVARTMKESVDVKETSYLEYSNEAQREDFDYTVSLSNFGGHFKLNTDASEESESNSVKTLVSNRLSIASSSITLIEPVKTSLVLSTKASTDASAVLELNYTKPIAAQSVDIVSVHKHTDSASAFFTESMQSVENISYELRRPQKEEAASKIIYVPESGPAQLLVTKASRDEVHTQDVSLTKQRVDAISTEVKSIIANTAEPITIQAKASSEASSTITEYINRPESRERAEISRTCANTIEPATFRVTESTEMSEITNYLFRREESHLEATTVAKQPLFGGAVILSTSSSKESTMLTDHNIESRGLKDGSAAIVRWVANTTEPVQLSSGSSKDSRTDSTCSFERSTQTERTAIVCRIPNVESFQKLFAESTTVTETTNLQFKRSEDCLEAAITIDLSREGGRTSLHSSASSSEEYNLHPDIVSTKVKSAEASITRIICNTTENPGLSTRHSTDQHSLTEALLDRRSDQEKAECVRKTLLRGDSQIFTLKESVHAQETTTCQLSKPQSSSDVSEVFKEAQFGGSFGLHTKATQYNASDVSIAIEKQRLSEQTTDIVVIEKRTTEPVMLSSSYSSEASVSCVNSIQRSNAYDNANVIRKASRQGENYGVRILESQELSEVNNLSLTRRNAEESKEITIKEPRSGGQIVYRSMDAKENYIDVEKHLSKTAAVQQAELSLKMANVDQPQSLSCSHSCLEEECVVCELYRREASQEESVRLKTAHDGGSTSLKSFQSEESYVNMSTHIDKDVKRSMENETTVAIPRFGGGNQIHCSAASEKSGEINLNLTRREAAEDNLRVIAISRDESLRFGVSASEEHEVTSSQSIVKSVDLVQPASVSIRTPLRGEHVEFASRASEQAIFNADCDYTKQPTGFVLNWTSYETRTEPSISMSTKASTVASTELAESDVRRRLVEFSTESVLERAHREISPVIFYSEQASETLIRQDEQVVSHEHRHVDSVATVRTETIREQEEFVCEAAAEMVRREELYREKETAKTASEKRVSFAAEVTEKTMSLDMDMSMTVERKEAPSIIKKPMKKERERRGRRGEIKRNEAPNFVSVRRNSLLMALNIGSPHNIPHFKTLQDIVTAIKEAGLEYSNLIFGIDYTRSNYYQGEKTYDGRSLHSLDSEEPNPYQQVIEIVGKTLSSFDADGIIPVYGFGDEECTDQSIFNLADKSDDDACCIGFEDVLRVYNEKTPTIAMSGPTNFVPLIEKAIEICREKHSYHILVIVADGQVTNEKINQKAIAAASHYPLSIIMVGVGDGPWNMMNRFDETLPKRMFDNFHFVDFHKVMFNAPNQEASFALNALMEIPDQYKAIKELGLLKHSRRG